MHSIHIRPASPSDIAEMIAVDDDACALYAQVGLHFDFAADHPFPRAEYARWTLAASEGLTEARIWISSRCECARCGRDSVAAW